MIFNRNFLNIYQLIGLLFVKYIYCDQPHCILNEKDLSLELDKSKNPIKILSTNCEFSSPLNESMKFDIQLQRTGQNRDSLVINFMNNNFEIFKQNNLFKFLVNNKEKSKNDIKRNFNIIQIETQESFLNIRVNNYFHMNWTEDEDIHIDFKDNKVSSYLCGLCETQIKTAISVRSKRLAYQNPYLKEFKARCQSNAECNSKNGLSCLGGICQCIQGFIFNTQFSICVINRKKHIHEKCVLDECNAAVNLVCSGICVCKAGFYYTYHLDITNGKCLPYLQLDRICSYQYECNPALVCLDGWCRKKIDYPE